MSVGVVELFIVMNANADWFPGLIWWTISPLLTGRAVCQWVLEFFFDMIVKQGHLKIHIESVQAKVEYIYVICVNIKLQHREFWRLIMKQSMKMSSTLVISVNMKENNRDIWILILNQSMRKSEDLHWISSWEIQVSL